MSTSPNSLAPLPAPTAWLIRIPEIFSPDRAEILRRLGATLLKSLAREFVLVRLEEPHTLHTLPAARWVSWNLPVHHLWPCHPAETTGFIEKAAQTMARKFSGLPLQGVFSGPLDPSPNRRLDRLLASNLRGRTLQLFPTNCQALRDAENQSPTDPSLFAMVGTEGLFCGVQSPRLCNGFHPGGTRFIRKNPDSTISRAGAKIAEALHLLPLHHPAPPAGAHWLELGASPGGMTAELLLRNYRVTAIDRAPLDARLAKSPLLDVIQSDSAAFFPPPGARYAALLCDMNGPPQAAFSEVIRLSKSLVPGGMVVFTLKTTGVSDLDAIDALEAEIVVRAASAGLKLTFRAHLASNRHEFTLVFHQASGQSPSNFFSSKEREPSRPT